MGEEVAFDHHAGRTVFDEEVVLQELGPPALEDVGGVMGIVKEVLEAAAVG